MARFLYLLQNKRKLRNIIDTVSSKVLLFMGRFTAERKPVLDALREEIGAVIGAPINWRAVYDPNTGGNRLVGFANEWGNQLPLTRRGPASSQSSRDFPPDFAWIFVLPQARETRVAQVIGVRPIRELDLRHQFGL
jgi:hypothetical protein